MPAPLRILILFAHPAFEKSRVNRAFIQAVRNAEGVTLHDLYQEYPDLHIDPKREQALLESHDVVVFQHPFYWYSVPAILKEWMDLVLEYGYAYGEGGDRLKGKHWVHAITAGGPEEAYGHEGYNRFTIREFLTPFDQTAYLCGMRFLPPIVTYGSLAIQPGRELDAAASAYLSRLLALRGEAHA